MHAVKNDAGGIKSELKDIHTFTRIWIAAQKSPDELPPFEEVALGSLGEAALRTALFGLGTSTGAMMEAEKVTIEHRIEAERYIANQKITNDAEAQKVNTRKQALGPLLDEGERLKRIAADASAALDTARVECAKAKSEQEIATTEAERELKGHPGYKKGAGPNYRGALKRKQDADAALAKCEAQVGIYEPRAVEANRKLDAVNASLQAGDTSVGNARHEPRLSSIR